MLIDMRDIWRSVILPNGEPLHILQGLSLQVAAGDYVSVVGRSGTGKSTLLNLIGMLDQPNTGSYTFAGESVVGLPDRRLSAIRGAEVGFVFQQFNLLQDRSVLENAALPLTYANGKEYWERFDRAAEMLDAVGLGHRLDDLPTQLSGGEQQRIAIARALVRNPRLILADEPTGALDPHTGSMVMDLLVKKAQETGAALIVITHDMAIAAHAPRRFELSGGVLNDHTAGAALATPTAPTASAAGATPAAPAEPTAPTAPIAPAEAAAPTGETAELSGGSRA